MIHKIAGVRTEYGMVLFVDSKQITPDESRKVHNHSPDGFNAGYAGSGPAQSALAILLSLTSKENALKFYQEFKWQFLANPEYLEADVFYFEVDLDKWMEENKRIF